MVWLNYYGIAIMAIIMIPNLVFAFARKDGFRDAYKNKAAETLEQIGRYGCFVFMIFNVPRTYFNFWFDNALAIYLAVNGALCLAYLIFWIICWNGGGKLKALSLSIIPSCAFLFSGIVLASVPLIVFAILFAANHILISYKNAVTNESRE